MSYLSSHSRGRRAGRAAGFTLIELFVVVAILGLLASILFPVFARARENARRSTCQTQMKQIGLGLLQYAQDYDETLPTMTSTSEGTFNATTPSHYSLVANSTFLYADDNAYQNWIKEIRPYTGSWDIFACPSANAKYFEDNNLGGYKPVGNSKSSYLVNAVVLQRKLSSLRQTSEIIWAQESSVVGNVAVVRPAVQSGSTVLPLASGTSGPSLFAWVEDYNAHFNGRNLLFCDGHVKWHVSNTIPARSFGLANTATFGPSGAAASTIDATLVG